MYWQQKREKYTSEKRTREEAEFEERKRKQREKVQHYCNNIAGILKLLSLQGFSKIHELKVASLSKNGA